MDGEDEEFYQMEQRKIEQDYLELAKKEGEKFIRDYANSLGNMTLRKAFEMGYRFGHGDAKR
jgi:hypothetical protein